MKYIAHRGNLNGPNPADENKPEYLLSAVSKGFHIETDLWVIEGRLYLGHDEPQYEIEPAFLLGIKDKLFCHCKNINALYYILENHSDIECFSHNEDECVLTSKGHIWNYPGKQLTTLTICVMPERVNQTISNACFGVCSDFVENIKEKGFLCK